MKYTPALCAALGLGALLTPLAHAQDLYVGSNTPFNTLDLTNGTNTFAYTYVGYEAGASNNTLHVVNSGTLLDNSQSLVVGNEGSGNSMVISNGGRVAALAGYVGIGPGSSNNSVLVTGTNSLWINSFLLFVGLDGSSNSLVISDGATVENDFGYVGYGATSSNNGVLVTGAGSVWTNRGDLYVGFSGSSHRMVISDGGKVYNVNGFDDGASPLDSFNSVLVTDAGSAWVNSGNLTFGLAGHDNSLIISNGGLVTVGTNAYAGDEATASNNSVLVTGTNAGGTASTLSVDGSLLVGNDGSGNSLVISNGGTVTNANAYIGYASNSAGNTVLVTGTNSVWANSETLLVGNSGSSNSLTISDGGMVAAGLRVAIGLDATSSNNAVLVTGAGSVWTNSDDLHVGEAGSGNSLVISNGGTVANGFGLIGLAVASFNNSVVVTGAGSVWSNSLGLVVGDYGSSNSLTISDGGMVASDFGLVGYGATSSNNSVLVTGAGSVWTNRGDLYVGFSGSSHRMVVADGGKVYNVNGFDDGASPLDSFNSVLVTDAGSAWVNSGNLTFGLAGHDNSLIISNGGLVTVGTNAYAGDEATASNNSVLVTGTNAGGTASTLSVVGSLLVGNNGSGNSLVISNGGTVAAAVGFIGTESESTGNNVLVTGAGSLWTNSNELSVGFFGSSNSLTVAEDGRVAASRIDLAAQAGSSGTLNIGRFGTNDTAGTIIAPTIAFGDGTGAINFNQSDAVTITSVISGHGTLSQLGAGPTTLSASNTYTGATTVSAGQLIVDGSIAASLVTVQHGGTLGGSGAVGSTTIESGGTISPGNSPGNLTVEDNLVWNGGGNYNWQVLGTTNTAGFAAGTTWDLLTVTGTLDLTALSAGSKFNINLWSLASTGPDIDGNISDFDFSTNYEWLAVDAGTIIGFNASSFAVNHVVTNGTAGFANALDPAGSFSVRQDGANLYVAYEVVPEPSTYALLALAAAGLGAHLLRRRFPGS